MLSWSHAFTMISFNKDGAVDGISLRSGRTAFLRLSFMVPSVASAILSKIELIEL